MGNIVKNALSIHSAPLLGGSTWHLDVGGLWLGVVSPFNDTCENLEIRAQAKHF